MLVCFSTPFFAARRIILPDANTLLGLAFLVVTTLDDLFQEVGLLVGGDEGEERRVTFDFIPKLIM